MGTEKFIAFKEDGSAYRLKGRILRFLDNEPVSEADKTNIRSTLSVPASAEGLTPANNLSDLDSAATARTNLSVNSKDEDAQANALKTTAPALFFNGTSSVVTVADDDKFSFTDGTDDLPFSISAFVKMTDATSFTIIGKYTGTSAEREWIFGTNGSDKLTLIVQDNAAGNSEAQESTTALTAYEGQWIHVAATYGGSGPNSASAFTSASDEITLYVNGSTVAMTDVSGGTYTGMSNAAGAVWIGRQSSTYSKGHIRDCKIFNRELTASEVAELARGNDLGFAEEWGDHTTEKLTDGGFENWASASDLTSWVEGSAVSTAQESVDIQSGTYSCELTGGGSIGSSGNNWLSQNAGIERRKRYRFTAKVKRVSGTTDSLQIGVTYYPFVTFDGTAFTANTNSTYLPESRIVSQSSLGSGWYSVTVEFVPNVGGSSVLAFGVTGGTDPYLIDDCSLVQVGTLADFRAEDYNESASKLLDRSSNNFVGVGTSVTLTGNQRHISADTIDLKNLPTSSAGLSAGEVWSNGGVLTVV